MNLIVLDTAHFTLKLVKQKSTRQFSDQLTQQEKEYLIFLTTDNHYYTLSSKSDQQIFHVIPYWEGGKTQAEKCLGVLKDDWSASVLIFTHNVFQEESLPFVECLNDI